jgi:CRP-like cAMP-binding protein
MAGYDRALLLTYLQQVPTFSACSETELEHLLALADMRAIEAGDVIIREGEVGDEFFLIAQGDVAVSRRGAAVAQLGPGSFFGELALFDDAPRNASVDAVGPTALAVFSRGRFRSALDDVPALRDSLLRGMARRLHDLDSKT